MAKFEDYLPGGQKDPAGGGLDAEINDAQQQQEARQEQNRDPQTGKFVSPSTPTVDWEQRYKELEKLNSRQAQTLGEYRKTIDEFIVNPTPAKPADDHKNEPATFSLDDFYDHPDEAIRKIVDSHPAIQEARALKRDAQEAKRNQDLQAFATRHPDYTEIGQSPEFQNWVMENPTRVDLFQRGDQYDFSAADALFSLYKAEKGLSQAASERAIAQAELEASSGELMPKEEPRYSRSEYINKLTRARQGDLDAEAWVKSHSARYRMALAEGNVRD
jgi:hypothetical protein